MCGGFPNFGPVDASGIVIRVGLVDPGDAEVSALLDGHAPRVGRPADTSLESVGPDGTWRSTRPSPLRNLHATAGTGIQARPEPLVPWAP